MWKCHHCKTRPTWKWESRGGGGTASQKAIKICDHLFPLPHLIHLSGEWFCPYPPKATNLFSCLSPCIRMNLWNSQTCSLSLLPLSLLLSPSLAGSTPFLICFFLSLCLCLWLPHCLSLLTFPLPQRLVLPPTLPLSISPCQKRLHESNSNHIQKRESNNKTLSMAI